MQYPGLVLSVQKSNYLAGSGTRSNRPKRTGPGASTGVPLHPTDADWAGEFIQSLTPTRSERTYLRLVRVGVAARIVGPVTPRSLRHTFLTQVARDTNDPSMVLRLGNVSPTVAIQYVRGAAQDRDVEYIKRRGARTGIVLTQQESHRVTRSEA